MAFYMFIVFMELTLTATFLQGVWVLYITLTKDGQPDEKKYGDYFFLTVNKIAIFTGLTL